MSAVSQFTEKADEVEADWDEERTKTIKSQILDSDYVLTRCDFFLLLLSPQSPRVNFGNVWACARQLVSSCSGFIYELCSRFMNIFYTNINELNEIIRIWCKAQAHEMPCTKNNLQARAFIYAYDFLFPFRIWMQSLESAFIVCRLSEINMYWTRISFLCDFFFFFLFPASRFVRILFTNTFVLAHTALHGLFTIVVQQPNEWMNEWMWHIVAAVGGVSII